MFLVLNLYEKRKKKKEKSQRNRVCVGRGDFTFNPSATAAPTTPTTPTTNTVIYANFVFSTNSLVGKGDGV
jgi:hypothetical protein